MVEHSSTPPSPWAGYKLCLSDLPDCSHVAILQDDTRPAENFAFALEQVARSQPEVPVCLFHARQPAVSARLIRYAQSKGHRYTDLKAGSFMPVVAVLWPKALAEAFLVWALEYEERSARRTHRSDDQMAGTWLKRTGQTVRICVPSLVEHVGVPTTKGQPNVESWRALAYTEDAALYEW